MQLDWKRKIKTSVMVTVGLGGNLKRIRKIMRTDIIPYWIKYLK